MGSRAVHAGFKLVEDVSIEMEEELYHMNAQNHLLLWEDIRAQMGREWDKSPSLAISYQELSSSAREEIKQGVGIKHNLITVVVQRPDA